MAHEPDLKSLYDGMAADEAEMAGYRRKLMAKLPSRRTSRSWWLYAFGTVALVAVLAAINLPQSAMDPFDKTVEELQTLAASREADVLTRKARAQLDSQSLTKQLNASAYLCMVLPYREAATIATNALQHDPRPKFRAFYLETLLDEADDYQINVEMVEKLMDSEEDELCFRLYSALLALG